MKQKYLKKVSVSEALKDCKSLTDDVVNVDYYIINILGCTKKKHCVLQTTIKLRNRKRFRE